MYFAINSPEVNIDEGKNLIKLYDDKLYKMLTTIGYEEGEKKE